MAFHLKNTTTGQTYRNGGSISSDHPLPGPEFEWVKGEPNKSDPLYRPETQADKLATMFGGLPLTVRAVFAPIRDSVEKALQAGDFDLAREIINQQKVPVELSTLKQQMLDAFNG